MSSYNLVFIATILSLPFIFASDDDTAYYEKMRKLAIGCTPDTKPWKNPASPCNTCSCMSDGVVVCTRMACTSTDDKPEPAEPQESEQEPQNPLGSENDPEAITAPEQGTEPDNQAESQSDTIDIEVYKKLRNDATACKPGEEVATDPCAGCTCILPGVMRCTAVKCLL